ncbi:MAG: aminoacyl-tRNA hydrolase [Helcococcus sp.]|nr:aminoacyl-tRNA hydrolase [Helcococcus sp.]
MYLIVGLGNPGRKYEKTRHNVGYDALDLIASKLNVDIKKVKFKGIYGETRYKSNKIILLKPETYMNASGISVAECARFYGINPENIIVLVDDIDIQFGSIRIKRNGSAGTHNGLKSIIQYLETIEFPRVKIAVNNKPPYMDLADFVLSKFTDNERKIVEKELELSCEAVFEILDNNIESAMNIFNSQTIG